MTTPSLIDWLRAQIDEDERLARKAGGIEWRAAGIDDKYVADARNGCAIACYTEVYPECAIGMDDDDAAHIANWDPARVLAEVQSKRAILDVHPIETDLSEYERGLGTGQSFGCRRCADDDGVIKGEGYCRTLQALAEPYRSRPGFRKEWLDG